MLSYQDLFVHADENHVTLSASAFTFGFTHAFTRQPFSPPAGELEESYRRGWALGLRTVGSKPTSVQVCE